MRKIFNKCMFIVIAACTLASCGDDDYEYVAGEQDALASYGNVYFPATSYSLELDPSETVYLIDIYRSDSTNAVTVPITLDGDTDVITSTDAVFAANQGKTTIELSFPNAVVGTQYSVNISAENTMYLVPCSFSVTRVKWNLVGTGTFTYGFFFEGDYAGMELYQRADKPEMFRIPNAVGGVNYTFTWEQETNEIAIDTFYAGFEYSSYGSVYITDGGDSYFDPETNVFYFNNEYIVSAGSFGSAYETFTLDSAISFE